MERKVAERERSGERTKYAAPASAPPDILLFSLHVTQINRSYYIFKQSVALTEFVVDTLICLLLRF